MSTTVETPDPSDIVAIQHLLVRFLWAADEGPPGEVAACFADDGEWRLGEAILSGPADIAAMIANMRAKGVAGPGSGARHLGSNVLVEVSGDTATARSCFTFVGQSEAGPVIRAVGSYHDTLIRKADGWRILQRTIGA